jgi:FkbM family methyltransferase
MNFFNIQLIIIRIKKIIFLISNFKFLIIFLKYRVVPSIEHLDVIKRTSFDFLIDVGSNYGQFSLLVNYLKPKCRISMIEPIKKCYLLQKKIFYNKKNIKLFNFAAFSKNVFKKNFFVTSKNDSSSLLKPGEIQANKFDTKIDKVIQVETKKLDDVVFNFNNLSNIFLKIDVQGSELDVLKGAKKLLKKINFIFIECSLVPFYENQMLFDEIVVFLNKYGFKLLSLNNVTVVSNECIQFDCLFIRKECS